VLRSLRLGGQLPRKIEGPKEMACLPFSLAGSLGQQRMHVSSLAQAAKALHAER